MITDQEVEKILDHLVKLREEVKRLGSSRSGAESGCAAAERCAPDGAEGRSREGGRVAPGKAKEAIAYCEDIAARRQAQSDDDHKKSRFVDAMLNSGEAAGWRGAAAVLTSIFFPADEPDSGAPQERSGRRNDQAD